MVAPGIVFGAGITLGQGITVATAGSPPPPPPPPPPPSYSSPYTAPFPQAVTTPGHFIYSSAQTSLPVVQALIALGNSIVGYTMANTSGGSQLVASQSYNSGTHEWTVILAGGLNYTPNVTFTA